MDVERCALYAAEIAAAYPRSRVSKLTLADWTQRLASVPEDERIPRIVHRLKNLDGPPEPRDFRTARRDEQPIFQAALPAPKSSELPPEVRDRWNETKARVAPWLQEVMERIESGSVPPDSQHQVTK